MLSAREILQSKGFRINEDTIDALEARWQGLHAARQAIELTYLKENQLGITNIAGGDDIDE